MARVEDPVGVDPRFTADGGSLEAFDPVERRSCTLRVGSASPREVSTDRFRFPVDAAVAVETDAVEFESVVHLVVRDEDGETVAEAGHVAFVDLDPGRYSVEAHGEVKLFLRVEAGVEVTANTEHTRVEFDRSVTLLVGARSGHERPVATVTTTEDPRDVMRAVSRFGSALKTLSPERSFPTLRGHVPELRLGDSFDAPDALDPPETGIRIEVPADLGAVYAVAPLAFYLGATVVPGDEPRVVADGFVHPLSGPPGFETRVARALKRSFLLDCAVRTEGLYPVDLHERERVEAATGLEMAALYDLPPAERLARYHDPPWEAIAPVVPRWRLAARVRPTPENLELLPYVVNDLATVRTAEDTPADSEHADAVGEFLRGATADGSFVRGGASDRLTRGAGGDWGGTVGVAPGGETDAVEEVWLGEGCPLGLNKVTAAGFRHRLERDPAEGDIAITVVCNDTRMDDERDVVDAVYGSQESLPFDVTVVHGAERSELRALLAEDREFLHYIGHIDHEGFECADGKLDAATLDSVGVDAFFLNACQSYEQGLALVEAGSIAGVVTHSDVVNEEAMRIGSVTARLLDGGFPMRTALTLAREESVMGKQYSVVGDGSLTISQTESVTPNGCLVSSTSEGYQAEILTYPIKGMGSLFRPHIGDNDQFYLVLSRHLTFEGLSGSQVTEFLSLEDMPFRVDAGDLRWSGETDLDKLL